MLMRFLSWNFTDFSPEGANQERITLAYLICGLGTVRHRKRVLFDNYVVIRCRRIQIIRAEW